jgi:hypothetical protein
MIGQRDIILGAERAKLRDALKPFVSRKLGKPGFSSYEALVIKKNDTGWQLKQAGYARAVAFEKKFIASGPQVPYNGRIHDHNPTSFYANLKWLITAESIIDQGFDGTKASLRGINVAKAARGAKTIVEAMKTEDMKVVKKACVAAAKKKGFVSAHEGVSWYTRGQNWMVRAPFVGGKSKHIGYFCDEEKAGLAWDKFCIDEELGRPLNYPDKAPTDYVVDAKEAKGATKQYKGTSYDKGRKKWQARIGSRGNTKHIGYYDDEAAAARAWDAESVRQKLYLPLNFPEDYPDYSRGVKPSRKTAAKRKRKRASVTDAPGRTSTFKGLVWLKRDKKWGVRVWIDGVKRSKGSFTDEREAATRYDNVCIGEELGWPLNFPKHGRARRYTVTTGDNPNARPKKKKRTK